MLRTTITKAFLGITTLAAQTNAFWRLPCSSPVVVERADPIVYPNAVSGHVHTVMGSNAFNFTMDYADTQSATCSTCKAVEDMSSYWVPNLYYHVEDDTFIPVKQSGGALIYYLQRSDPDDPNYAQGLIAFPPDFRMLAGTPTNRLFTDTLEQRAISFVCLGADNPTETFDLPNLNCPDGLRAQLTMPSCWDGINLDSEDHKSHMAYPSDLDNGVCPPSHPRRFITLFYEVTWSVDAFKDMWYSDKQPFVFSNGDPTGYGYHGDFINGWETQALQTAIDKCTSTNGDIEECPAFTLRPDEDMALCKVLPRVHEAVTNNKNGAPLDTLPGCNPVSLVPLPSTPDPNPCGDGGADSEIGDPILPYTDLTQLLAWRYLACAKDPVGRDRTLGDLFVDETDMTVVKCVELCRDSGFTHAGVEDGSQCFCGLGVPPDRLPAPGSIGDCTLPCAGDPDMACGGSSMLAVYVKCVDEDGDCINAVL